MTLTSILVALAAARHETYFEYVTRAVEKRTDDSNISLALRASEEPFVTTSMLAPLVAANSEFIDGIVATQSDTASPSTNALFLVPLLIQLVRDWSAAGRRARDSTYRPVVDALVPVLQGVPSPRILVPGSGTGRLAYMLAYHLPGSRLVALDPDEHAQRAAAFFLTAGDMQLHGADESAASGRSAAAPTLPATIYPSLHVSTHWQRTAHRLAGITLPDVTISRLKRVERESNITFAVGSLEEVAENWLAGGELDEEEAAEAAAAEAEADAEAEAEADAYADDAGGGGARRADTRRGYNAVATCFVLDVLRDMLLALKALHAMLTPARGVWANLGPLAFPDPHEGLRPANEQAVVLTAAQQLHLVRQAGFEIIEERYVEDCEYNTLPHRMERTLRTCLFFVARPAAAAEEGARQAASPRPELHDEL